MISKLILYGVQRSFFNELLGSLRFASHAQGTLKEFLAPNQFFQLCLDAAQQNPTFEIFLNRIQPIPTQRPQDVGAFEFYESATSLAVLVSVARFSELLTTTPGQQDGGNQAFKSWDLVRQNLLNKLMHILNGNTRIHLDLCCNQLFGRLELKLSNLIPQPSPSLSQAPIQSGLPTYDRNFLLSRRPYPISVSDSQNPLQTTTHSFSYAASAAPPKRTGRRIKILKPDGTIYFKKTPKAKRPQQFHRIERIQNNIIRNQSRTPPPVGAPADSIRVHEECSPKVDRVKGTTRGTTRRRLRRRAYRQWCSGLNKEWIKGLGPPILPFHSPKTQPAPGQHGSANQFIGRKTFAEERVGKQFNFRPQRL